MVVCIIVLDCKLYEKWVLLRIAIPELICHRLKKGGSPGLSAWTSSLSTTELRASCHTRGLRQVELVSLWRCIQSQQDGDTNEEADTYQCSGVEYSEG
jgi:hypothetical protein